MSEKKYGKVISITLKAQQVRKDPSHIPVRQPVTRSKGRVVGYYASFKNKRPIAWESLLECRACALFEFSPAIKAFKEQPIKLRFLLEDKFVTYTPDFELEFLCGGKALVEIKPLKYLQLPENREKYSVAAEEAYRLGYDFIILTEHEIYQPNFSSNLTVLKHYLPVKLTREEVEITLNWVKHQDQPRIFQLQKFMVCRQKAYALIAHGHVSMDLHLPIMNTSKIFLNKENYDEACLFNGRFAPEFE